MQKYKVFVKEMMQKRKKKEMVMEKKDRERWEKEREKRKVMASLVLQRCVSSPSVRKKRVQCYLC